MKPHEEVGWWQTRETSRLKFLLLDPFLSFDLCFFVKHSLDHISTFVKAILQMFW